MRKYKESAEKSLKIRMKTRKTLGCTMDLCDSIKMHFLEPDRRLIMVTHRTIFHIRTNNGILPFLEKNCEGFDLSWQ